MKFIAYKVELLKKSVEDKVKDGIPFKNVYNFTLSEIVGIEKYAHQNMIPLIITPEGIMSSVMVSKSFNQKVIVDYQNFLEIETNGMPLIELILDDDDDDDDDDDGDGDGDESFDITFDDESSDYEEESSDYDDD